MLFDNGNTTSIKNPLLQYVNLWRKKINGNMATHSSNHVKTDREVTFLFIQIYEQIEHISMLYLTTCIIVNGHISYALSSYLNESGWGDVPPCCLPCFNPWNNRNLGFKSINQFVRINSLKNITNCAVLLSIVMYIKSVF